MGWIDDLLGKKDSYTRMLQKVREREAAEEKEKENSRLPVAGKMASTEDKKNKEIEDKEDLQARESESYEQEEKLREETSQDLLLVIDGARLECITCTQPEGVLKVNLDTPSTQEKRTATTAERDAHSLIFKGNCIKSPNAASPCAAVMNLENWKNTGLLKVQEEKPLLKKSTICCLYGQTEIKITDSGQINEPELPPLNTLDEGLEIVSIKGFITDREGQEKEIPVSACRTIECVACYTGNGNPDLEDIRWRVKVGSRDSIEIESLETQLKKGLAYPYGLTGGLIYFPVPKEWGQETLVFEAYSRNPKIKITQSEEITVKDHIIAAFCRTSPLKAVYETINVAEKAKGTWDVFSFLKAYVHHHQGMYRQNGIFYISGSTGISPCYMYVTGEQASQLLLFNRGVLEKYKHPGGLQIANGLLAVGLEEYETGGAFVKKQSVVCFYDACSADINSSEFTHLRIIRDKSYDSKVKYLRQDNIYEGGGHIKREYKEEDEAYSKNITIKNDMASAVGIVYYKEEWIVAVRGDNQSIDFYVIDKDKKNIRLLKSGFTQVGEFQNLNLFLDENQEIYMFGMGNPGNSCSMYRVEIDTQSNTVAIYAVWIKNGIIKEAGYSQTEDNTVRFACKSPTSFNWASCIELKEDVSQTQESGFLGRFTVFAIGPKVIDNKEIPCNSFKEEVF